MDQLEGLVRQAQRRGEMRRHEDARQIAFEIDAGKEHCEDSVLTVRSAGAPAALLAAIRRLCEAAYGEPLEEDWDHALGGTHFVIEEDAEPVSHASVVERRVEAARAMLRCGYVEAVATRPDRRGRGLAGEIMAAATDHIRERYELGGLCTGENAFYERFGWETWRGPTFVRAAEGLVRTEHEDGNVMILRTATTPDLDPTGPIVCDWRPGDAW